METTNIDRTADAVDPTDPYVRTVQTFPVLNQEQIGRARLIGREESLPKGTILFERGERSVDFFIVLQGNIEIYEHRHDEPNVFTVHGEHQFTGEIDLFNSRQILVGGRMGEDGSVLRFNRQQFRKLIAAEPDIGEIVMRAFILRRMGLISHKQGSVTLIAIKESADHLRIERFLRRNGYPLEILSYDVACQETTFLKDVDLTEDQLPVVYIHLGEQLLYNPSNLELAEQLGLVEVLPPDHVYDVAIVGGGPAGLSAAVGNALKGITVLSTVLRRLERGQQINQLTSLVAVTPEEQQKGLQQLDISETETALLLSLLDLGLNPASVKANLLSMLALPPDLKKAIREQGLKGAHALALASLSAKTLKIAERQATKERLAATQAVIEQDLTVAKTRELVAQVKAKYLNPTPVESKEIAIAAKGLEKLSPDVMKTTNQEQLVELRQILQQKLAEIEAILAE